MSTMETFEHESILQFDHTQRLPEVNEARSC